MVEIADTGDARNFGRSKEQARREPVALHTSELPGTIAATIENARMEAAHDHLNGLLD